jgi:hypothetical protein
LKDLPRDDDELAWIALMRHYGAPSRLLDWTKSPYIAAFFAARDAKDDKPWAIWAINQFKLKKHALNMMRSREVLNTLAKRNPRFDEQRDLASWEDFISSCENFKVTFFVRLKKEGDLPAIVAPVEPFRTSERMTIQQGAFLCANTLRSPFKWILAATLKEASAGTEWLKKLEIAAAARIEVLAELHRMNITEATLYPGIDGFARSLAVSAEIPGMAPAGMGKLLWGDNAPREPRVE